MPIDKDTVATIAQLARIDVAEDDRERIAGELSNILAWVEQLGEVDTEGVAPMTSVVDVALPRRADAVTDGGDAEDVLANAPKRDDGFFVVPKVVE